VGREVQALQDVVARQRNVEAAISLLEAFKSIDAHLALLGVLSLTLPFTCVESIGLLDEPRVNIPASSHEHCGYIL
jgi:hypothetical protein